MVRGVKLKGKVNGRYFEGGGLSTTLSEMRLLAEMGYVRYEDMKPDGGYSITEAGLQFFQNGNTLQG
jgi:hypothetical protein